MANLKPFNGGDNSRQFKSNRSFGPRRNERIRAPKVRVIGADGKQLGIMSPYEALSIARKSGLDLLEVSPNSEPPVCRILDYGKYMYEEAKKQKSHKTATVKLKEIMLRPAIEINDFMTKIRNAGAIFLGEYSSEPLGDYYAGPNHILPTNGTARFFSPLGADDFVKKSSIIYYSQEALKAAHRDIEAFAEAEGLTAHANSIKVRFE